MCNLKFNAIDRDGFLDVKFFVKILFKLFNQRYSISKAQNLIF